MSNIKHYLIIVRFYAKIKIFYIFLSMIAISERIYTLKDYLKKKYGRRVQKITVALPFTCPNIDGTKAVGGCTYCLTGTRPAHISPTEDLRSQIANGIAQAKR
ncbi:MAG: hypothetical protein QXI20_09820, partial [Candidatus Jordarchaeales archaeon]